MKVRDLMLLLGEKSPDAEVVVGRKEALAEKNEYMLDDIAKITQVDKEDGKIVIVYDTFSKPWINQPASAT